MPSIEYRAEQTEPATATAPHGAGWKARRALPFLTALTAFAIMTALYLGGPRPLYDWILKTWGILPYPFVFLDTDTVLSAVRCLRKGVDVFVTNPCDDLGRLFDYSPLWLLLAKLPPSMTQLVPLGLIVDAFFFLSLLLLPVGATWRESRLITLGAISTAAVFAVERANNDLVLFVLAAAAAALACRSRGLRLVGYGAALLAGLLKYYPMTTLALATREKPGRFLLVVALVCGGIALFVLTMGGDLVRALRLIPTGDWFHDMFGSSTLAGGLTQRFGWTTAAQTVIHLAMSITALCIGVTLATRSRIGDAIGALDERHRNFLLVGAMLTVSCFFTAQNIGYRAIHLLLTLPSLLALARGGVGTRLIRWAPTLTLLLLWAEGWRNAIQQLEDVVDGDMVRFVSWIMREAIWWTVITLLIASIVSILLRSEIGRWLLPSFGAARTKLAS